MNFNHIEIINSGYNATKRNKGTYDEHAIR